MPCRVIEAETRKVRAGPVGRELSRLPRPVESTREGKSDSMTSAAWWRDFEYANGVLHVRKTGVDVPVGAGVAMEAASWLAFHACVEATRLAVRADGPKLWFALDRPRPWYLLWPVMQLAGIRIVARREDAECIFIFDDRTHTHIDGSLQAGSALNGGCLNVSKSKVVAVFEAVFDRPLSVDPQTWDGAMVAKSELNGVHDGRVLTGPRAAEAGQVYQRLIETAGADGCVEDLRCPTVGGRIPLVFIKRRPVERRFENTNSSVTLAAPSAVFTQTELDQLSAFCREMKLDWGGLDVLRDRKSGALYVVDVNKTDMGPPIALPMKDKMRAVRTLAAALRAFLEERREASLPE